MIFDEDARRLHESLTECYACGKEFDGDKVRDHCHYTGKYRGALHSQCNLRLRRTRTIPVIFHNLSGYDSHLFVKRLADTVGRVDCIPQNAEKYITFNKKNVHVDTIVRDEKEIKVYTRLKFVDSFRLMQSSLASLVRNIDRFDHTSRYFGAEQQELFRRKEVYPYEYIRRGLRAREGAVGRVRVQEPCGLHEDLLQDRHPPARGRVRRPHRCLSRKVQAGSGILPHVRRPCLGRYVEVDGGPELQTDPDMYLFFEEGIRGGVLSAMKRYSKANNVYMKDYEPEKPDVTTERVTKVALSSNDDKQIIIPNDPGHRMLALSHWRAKHPALYDAEINTDELFKKGTLMNLAYNAIR